MFRTLLFLVIFFQCSLSEASFEGKCVVSGQVASAVKEVSFPANGTRIKYISFDLKLALAEGLKLGYNEWCSDVFSERAGKKGLVKIRINNPAAGTEIPKIGEPAKYLWSYFESEWSSAEGFSPYPPPEEKSGEKVDSGG